MADKTDDAPGRELTWSEQVEARLDALEAKVKGSGGKQKGKDDGKDGKDDDGAKGGK